MRGLTAYLKWRPERLRWDTAAVCIRLTPQVDQVDVDVVHLGPLTTSNPGTVKRQSNGELVADQFAACLIFVCTYFAIHQVLTKEKPMNSLQISCT